jgi:aspartate/methionine/tyrosine aminotransferase
MYPPTRYLQWARRFYGQVEFDLASSGIPAVEPEATRHTGTGDLATAWTELCRRIARHNDVAAEEAIPALGTTHALWLACNALLAPGDEVLVEAPVYEPLLRIPEGLGARVVSFRRKASEGFAIDPDRAARAMTPRTRAVLVSNLHNPSGVRASDDALRALARAAEPLGAHVVVDEVYAEFDAMVDAGGVYRNSARKLGPNVVAVSSLTKCYGLGPARIGWMLGPPPVIERAGDALLASAGMLPAGHVRGACAAFDEVPALAARSRALLAGKRERVAQWVASRGLSWSAPVEGTFGFVVVPGRGDLTLAIEAAARDHQVLVAPGAFFGVPEAFRLAWSIPGDRLDEGLDRLAHALRL